MKMMVHVWHSVGTERREADIKVAWADLARCCQGKCEGGDQGGVSSLLSRDIILTLGLCGRH